MEMLWEGSHVDRLGDTPEQSQHNRKGVRFFPNSHELWFGQSESTEAETTASPDPGEKVSAASPGGQTPCLLHTRPHRDPGIQARLARTAPRGPGSNVPPGPQRPAQMQPLATAVETYNNSSRRSRWARSRSRFPPGRWRGCARCSYRAAALAACSRAPGHSACGTRTDASPVGERGAQLCTPGGVGATRQWQQAGPGTETSWRECDPVRLTPTGSETQGTSKSPSYSQATDFPRPEAKPLSPVPSYSEPVPSFGGPHFIGEQTRARDGCWPR